MAQTGNSPTELLIEWSGGNRNALHQLMPLIYGELRQIAQAHLRKERPGHTLQRTVLVHEAFLRLIDQNRVQWQNKTHFLGLASQAMRRILVDHARARFSAKRGQGADHVSLDEAFVTPGDGDAEADPVWLRNAAGRPNVDLVALDDALNRLESLDEQQGKIVEMRFFGGLTIDETAAALGISPATVKRDWSMAKAWLHRELAE